jgi:hypothetical protein
MKTINYFTHDSVLAETQPSPPAEQSEANLLRNTSIRITTNIVLKKNRYQLAQHLMLGLCCEMMTHIPSGIPNITR